MIELIIDGIKVRVSKGSTVLEAAREMGIIIPTLCYYPGLSTYGACRVCLVEVIKSNRSSLEASCTLPAEDGQIILTNTERVHKTRRVMLELLLSACPNSKTIQCMASNFGVNKVRFKIKDKNCILCGLCVRYCKEQMQSGGIGFISRGNSRQVATPFRTTPQECRNCGGCEWICPVCERASLADNLLNGLCGGCQNYMPVETCTVCIGCSKSVNSHGHKVF